MSSYLPNFGRPDGRISPVGLWKYPDPNAPLVVNLVVAPARGIRSTPRDSHWMFTWDVAMTNTGQIAQRRCHLVQEVGYDHLTSWGALTVAVDVKENSTKTVIPLKTMPFAQRQAFEKIADTAGVLKPNGVWNCQDWCTTILTEAGKQGILTQAEIKKALDIAQRVPIAKA